MNYFKQPFVQPKYENWRPTEEKGRLMPSEYGEVIWHEKHYSNSGGGTEIYFFNPETQEIKWTKPESDGRGVIIIPWREVKEDQNPSGNSFYDPAHPTGADISTTIWNNGQSNEWGQANGDDGRHTITTHLDDYQHSRRPVHIQAQTVNLISATQAYSQESQPSYRSNMFDFFKCFPPPVASTSSLPALTDASHTIQNPQICSTQASLTTAAEAGPTSTLTENQSLRSSTSDEGTNSRGRKETEKIEEIDEVETASTTSVALSIRKGGLASTSPQERTNKNKNESALLGEPRSICPNFPPFQSSTESSNETRPVSNVREEFRGILFSNFHSVSHRDSSEGTVKVKTKEEDEFRVKKEENKKTEFHCSCGCTFLSQALFDEHWDNPDCPDAGKKFHCKHCSRRYASLGPLRRHLACEHQIHDEIAKNALGCSFCGAIFLDKHALERHRERNHRNKKKC